MKVDPVCKMEVEHGNVILEYNGEIYATAMERVSSGTASSIYMTNDGGDTWILEGTNNSELAMTKNT